MVLKTNITIKMEQKKVKIYPYLIEEKRMAGYYELLLEDKYRLKIFDKKKDRVIYDYFMPSVREYLFWSFDMNQKDTIEEYNQMDNDLKAAICSTYPCNIFEKGKNLVICFNTGICFAVTDDKKVVDKLTKYENTQEMEVINLRSEDAYELKDNKEEHLYAYALELYKLIFLNKINKELQNQNLFDKARNSFVEFTQKVFDITETDKDKFCETLRDKFKLDKKYVAVENQFDLLYKNNKLNENIVYNRFAIILFIVFIIIGIINLGNWLGSL